MGQADFYKVMARTGDGRSDISCFLVPADAAGLSSSPPEKKMGLTGSADDHDELRRRARSPPTDCSGPRATGCGSRWPAWTRGGSGIAAVATGLAQGALDAAVAYAQERETFGKRIIDHQGLGVRAGRHGGRRAVGARDVRCTRPGSRTPAVPFGREASVAKLVATDNAMKVTTDAVQVLGGYGYTRDFPVERYMREAKVMQIFEGTNQIQRMVIGRALDTDEPGSIGSV